MDKNFSPGGPVSTGDRTRALGSEVEAREDRLLAKLKTFGTCPDDDTTDGNQAQAQRDSATLTNFLRSTPHTCHIKTGGSGQLSPTIRSETQASRHRAIPWELDSAGNDHSAQAPGTKGAQSKREVSMECCSGHQSGWNAGIPSEPMKIVKQARV